MSSLVTKIGKQVNQMTKSQKKVANYLLFNMDKLLHCRRAGQGCQREHGDSGTLRPGA